MRNMKFTPLLLALLATSTLALDTSCFELADTINTTSTTVKVVSHQTPFLALSSGSILPVKELFSRETPEYIDYTIVASSGVSAPQASTILDNDPATQIAFTSAPKSLTLRLDTPVEAGKFAVSIDAYDYDFLEVEISSDGKKYQSIFFPEIENFSFQFIRLTWVDLLKDTKNPLFTATKVRDILFQRDPTRTLVISGISGSSIQLFTKSYCSDISFPQLQKKANE